MNKTLVMLWLLASGVLAPAAVMAQETETIRIDDMILNVTPYRANGATGFYVQSSVKWPGGVVPVAFDPSVTAAQRQTLVQLCNQYWRAHGNVQCVGRTTQATYVYVTKKPDGCYAAVGSAPPTRGEARTLNLAENCWSRRVILHELGHTLGFMHEQNHPLRDRFVQIRWENIQPGMEYNFQLFQQSSSDFYTTTYDFGSIMHYDGMAFSRNGQPTIVPWPQYAALAQGMGTTEVPSALDGAIVRAVYGANTATAPAPPTLVLDSAVNPIALRWAANPSGAAPTSYVLQVGLQPGRTDWTYAMGTSTSLSAMAPIGVPLYLRIVASNGVGSATSNEVQVVARTGLTMNAPQVYGRTVTLSWSGASRVVLLVRFQPSGPIVATFQASGSQVTVGAGPGTYYVSVSADGRTESNQVAVVVR